jgi:NADPH:quinone reductase-like Zn-dependent oxidoreductase
VFTFDKAKEAFRYFAEQKHVGKVVIRLEPTSRP